MTDEDILIWYESLESATCNTESPEAAIVAEVRSLLEREKAELLAALRDLIEHWKAEAKRCYELAHKKLKVEETVMAQSVRFWECARELEALIPAAGQTALGALIQKRVAEAWAEGLEEAALECDRLAREKKLKNAWLIGKLIRAMKEQEKSKAR